jgi:PAS domain S-box-containing protein
MFDDDRPSMESPAKGESMATASQGLFLRGPRSLGQRCNFRGLRSSILVLLAACLLSQSTALAQSKPVRRVLLLNVFSPVSSSGVAAIDQAVAAGIQKSPYQIELYTEDLETTLFSDPAKQQEFRDSYIKKYRDRKPDVIIAAGFEALEFMVASHRQIFPGVPIVFCATTKQMLGQMQLDSDVTGVWTVDQPEKTLQVALRLLPHTTHVVVTGGVGVYDRDIETTVRAAFRKYESRLSFTYLSDLDMPTLLDRLKHLPDHTIVYHTAMTKDAAGASFMNANQAVPLVAGAANAPVFVVDDVDIRDGTVGGDVSSFSEEGRIVADMTVRILNGEKPRDIPIMEGGNRYTFDWLALKRWGLKESDLPSGSTVLNRQPTFWEAYKQYIIAAIFVLLAQILVIAGLLWQRAKRRKAEVLQRESEGRFRLVANSAPVMIWMCAPDKLCTYVNQPWLDFTGRPLETELGSSWAEGVHPEDKQACVEAYAQAFDRRQPFTIEYRLRRQDGEYRWILDSGVPRLNADGSFAGYIGSAVDVTDRKRAEEALACLSGRLIEAQEQERHHIARELHDDISQKLALLFIELQQLAHTVPDSQAQLGNRLDPFFDRISKICSDVHALSHRLHSSKLETLGLVAAMRGFCRELAEQRDVKIDLTDDEIPKVLPPQVSLCLFRILQEGLSNALKHSGVRQFEVRLERVSDQVELTIRDPGVGFDPGMAMYSEGLGLISMRERINNVKGTISIVSKPQGGTEIKVRVPIAASTDTGQMTASA